MNIKTQLLAVGLIGLLVGVIIGFCISEKDDHYHEDKYGMGMMEEEEDCGHGGHGCGLTTNDKSQGMGKMMIGEDDDMGDIHSMHDMMVSSEREFIEEMIPHHQEAVDTAKEVIARGATTPEIRTLVDGIVVTQEKEIADMKAWYQDWYGEEYQDKGVYQSMMRDLENLSGIDIDRAFLEDMIKHHMGAIMMARSVQSYAEHEEMKNLVKAVGETQSEEVILMRQLLGGL